MPDSVAEMEYRILLEFNPQDTATRSLLGMVLFRQKKFTEAEKEFRQILVREPKNFDALDSLGLTLYSQKRTVESITILQTAMKIRPDDVLVHLHLGRALSDNGQKEAAHDEFEAGLNLLKKQPPSQAQKEQMAEFQALLTTNTAQAGNLSRTKEK